MIFNPTLKKNVEWTARRLGHTATWTELAPGKPGGKVTLKGECSVCAAKGSSTERGWKDKSPMRTACGPLLHEVCNQAKDAKAAESFLKYGA